MYSGQMSRVNEKTWRVGQSCKSTQGLAKFENFACGVYFGTISRVNLPRAAAHVSLLISRSVFLEVALKLGYFN